MHQDLVRIEDATVAFDRVRAVDRVSLAIRPGETLGLIGESGSGKSTLARLLVDLVRPSVGRVRFDGSDLAALTGAARRAYRRDAQMIFQDPVASLSPRMKIGRLLAEPLEIHGIDKAEAWPGVLALLRRG